MFWIVVVLENKRSTDGPSCNGHHGVLQDVLVLTAIHFFLHTAKSSHATSGETIPYHHRAPVKLHSGHLVLGIVPSAPRPSYELNTIKFEKIELAFVGPQHSGLYGVISQDVAWDLFALWRTKWIAISTRSSWRTPCCPPYEDPLVDLLFSSTTSTQNIDWILLKTSSDADGWPSLPGPANPRIWTSSNSCGISSRGS